MGHQVAIMAHTVTQTSVSTVHTPLELRIQKYGYLADGKQTKYLRLNSAARAVLCQATTSSSAGSVSVYMSTAWEVPGTVCFTTSVLWLWALSALATWDSAATGSYCMCLASITHDKVTCTLVVEQTDAPIWYYCNIAIYWYCNTDMYCNFFSLTNSGRSHTSYWFTDPPHQS